MVPLPPGRRGGPRSDPADHQLRQPRPIRDGWPDYKACVSIDREDWIRIAEHQLRRRRADDPLTPPKPTSSGSPISRLIRWSGTTTSCRPVAALPGVDYRSLGKSLDGQDIDCLTIGEGS